MLLLKKMSNEKLILALDFGGTKLSAASVKHGGREFFARASVSSPPCKSAESDRKLMLNLAKEVLKGCEPVAVGVSFGGPVRSSAGVVILSHHVPGWENFPLASWLSEHFGVPAVVENDANAGALGEWRYGAGQGTKNLFYVTVSTGIGGGIVIDGKIYRGADDLAGEIGHMTLDPNGPLCTCGKRGCLEALASGPAIARKAQEMLSVLPEEGLILRELVKGDIQKISAQDVSKAAQLGDQFAARILQMAGVALGLGLAQVISLLNPERIILGGGVVKAGNFLLDPVRETAQKYAIAGARVEIVTAKLGDDAPLWGAVALAESLL